MKYKDPNTGMYKDLYFKTGDTLPVGTVVEYDGDEVPPGYKEVPGVVASVVVSPTEPETGEEVWIQKGKNLFEPSKVMSGYVSNDTGIISGNGVSTSYIPVVGNQSYYIFSGKTSGNWGAWYDSNKKFISGIALGGEQYGIFQAPSNAKYMVFTVSYANNNPNYASNVMIANSSVRIDYEPYMDKKIYIKNDTGAYEEFYDETNREVYSISEQRIGIWIDGKPLYRRVIETTKPSIKDEWQVVAEMPYIDVITNCYVFTYDSAYNQKYPLNNNSLPIYWENNNLLIKSSTDYWTNKQTKIIIEYTKTTD